jgi:hypothetical protein
MVQKFEEHRVPLRSIRARAHGGDATLARDVAAFNAHVHGRLRDTLRPLHGAIRHPDPEVAVEFGLFLVSAGAREAVLNDVLAGYTLNCDGARLVDELTASWLAYLGIAPRSRRSPR